MQPGEIVKFLTQLCDLASDETLPRFRQNVTTENKCEGGFDPVTAADREAERKIRGAIMSQYPTHEIIGEEFGRYNEGAEFSWIIDPIDGTRAFISGIPVWGTLIGLYKNGVPLAGAMDQPFTGERFISDGVKTTYSRLGTTYQARTSSNKLFENAILMTTMPELFVDDDALAFRNLQEHCLLTRYGTDCYAFAMLSAGHVDLVIETGVQLYDIAALIPLVENAGGIFTDWDGNSNPKGGRVIAAANKQLHSSAIEVLNSA